MISSLNPLLITGRWSARCRHSPACTTLRLSPPFARQGPLKAPQPAALDFNDLGSSQARMGLGTGLCKCGEAVETRQHYFFECLLYTDDH
jgi:hypothetical protein